MSARDGAPAGSLEDFLAAQAAGMCHVDYWRAVSQLWCRADREQRRSVAWDETWRRAAIAPGSRSSLMGAEEQAALAALPEHVTIHRGFAGSDWRGWDWVLAPAAAERRASEAAAARRGEPCVAWAVVPRARIVALFDADGAIEVVVAPDGLAPVISAGSARREPGSSS